MGSGAAVRVEILGGRAGPGKGRGGCCERSGGDRGKSAAAITLAEARKGERRCVAAGVVTYEARLTVLLDASCMVVFVSQKESFAQECRAA